MGSNDQRLVDELQELISAHPELPVYIKEVGGRSGWMVAVEDSEDGPTLLVEFN